MTGAHFVQNSGVRVEADAGKRFRVWTCASAVVLSMVAFLVAVAAAVTHTAGIRAAAAAATGCAFLAWLGSGVVGRYDRRSIAPDTRPKRLALRYVVISYVVAGVTGAVGAEAGAPASWRPVPGAGVAGILALVTAAGVVAWQIGLSTRVDLDAAAHVRGALTVAEPAAKPAAPAPASASAQESASAQASARPASAPAPASVPESGGRVSTAAAAEGVRKRHRAG